MRESAPPFRVLEKCQELCMHDRTATNNLVRACTSFDFQPGSRIASFSGAAEYEESTCYLTREQAQPEGIGNLMLVPNSVHFTEVCLACKYPHIDRKKYHRIHRDSFFNWNNCSFMNSFIRRTNQQLFSCDLFSLILMEMEQTILHEKG